MKLLITGGSGFLGTRILKYYQSRYECIVPSHAELEICDKSSCMKAVASFSPDCVIHTAAISHTGICERHPEETWQVNVAGTENLAGACAAAGSRLIFMSSDQVYNGSKAEDANRESDRCMPVNVYGRQKLEAEQRVLEILPDAAVLRLSWLYDLPTLEADVKENYLTRIIDAVNHKTRISFSDQDYRGITYVNEVVLNLEQVFQVPGGIYNFGSCGEESVYILARQVFRMLGADERADSLLVPQSDAGPRNLKMDQQRPKDHGIYFSENREGILSCLKEKM